uniref:Uncharacterized protein n=1 Tax=Meloidogyne enterolobii TaxID=390850 RepID=A0A6V7XC01_MELEN|nr:unnamed protein product [Meloidogyne enterolobii]
MVQSESVKKKEDVVFGKGDFVLYKNNSSEKRQGHQGKTFMRKKVAEAKGQEPATICIGNNNNNNSQRKRVGSQLSTTSGIDGGTDHGFLSWSSFRKKTKWKCRF